MSRLPPSAEEDVARFFDREAAQGGAGARWFALLQARPPLTSARPPLGLALISL